MNRKIPANWNGPANLSAAQQTCAGDQRRRVVLTHDWVTRLSIVSLALLIPAYKRWQRLILSRRPNIIFFRKKVWAVKDASNPSVSRADDHQRLEMTKALPMPMKIKFNLTTIGMFLAAVTSGWSQQTTFTRISDGGIANDLGAFVYSSWGDFNNDGFLDLFVCNHGNSENVFYHNNGDGTFTPVTQGDPVQDADYHLGAAAGDYDNDGKLDLVVSSGVAAPSARGIRLYHNAGNGTFSLASGGSVTNQFGFFGPSAWADYDQDGFLDLFVANHGDANDGGGRNLLFHNNQDGTFSKVTTGPVVTDVSVGYDCLWADYDNDGREDLLVVNYANNGVNFLYHNDGHGVFSRVTNVVGSDRWSAGSSGAAWGDYNNDGFLDLFVSGNGGTPDRLTEIMGT